MPRIVLIHSEQRSGAAGDRFRDSLALAMPDVVCDKVDWGGRHTGQGSAIRQLLDGAAGILVLVSSDTTGSETVSENTDGDHPVSGALEIALASGMPVIPVLTGGMQLSALMGLSAPFAELLQHAPLELRHTKWDDDVARIVDRIEWQLSDPNTLPYWHTLRGEVGNGRPRSRWLRFGAHADQVRRRIIPRSSYWRRVSRTLLALLVVIVGFGSYGAYRFWDERYERAASRLATQLSYGQSINTRIAAIQGLQDVAQRARRSRVSDFVVLAFKAVVLSSLQNEDARVLRRRALEAMKDIRANDLRADFSAGELRDSNLFRADLSSAKLQRVSFEDAWLEGVRFNDADLSNASLSGAYVRNGDFSGANLLGADLTELDWYDAAGVTEPQLQSAAQNGIRRCPSDDKTRSHSEAAFRAKLTDEYDMSWEKFAEVDRRKLTQLWNEYARPSGLCERVDRWAK